MLALVLELLGRVLIPLAVLGLAVRGIGGLFATFFLGLLVEPYSRWRRSR